MTPNSEARTERVERDRIRALKSYGILDSPHDPVFDDLTALAASICQAPISLVSLVDETRQWFKSHHGLEIRETPRSISFCDYTVRQAEDIFVVEDARADARFAENPLVTGGPGIRFYAGAQLRTPDGHVLGTICVIDRQPRTLAPQQMEALRILARLTMSQLELRRANAALQVSEERFESIARAVSDVIWDWNVDTGTLWWSEGFFTVFGYPPESTPPGMESWSDHIHPDDRRRVLDSLRHAVDSGQTSWTEEYQFRRYNGSYAIVLDRGQILRDRHGRAHRLVGGMSDLTERKRLESQSLRAQRMESIGALAGGIAHDLNNVLTPILISLGMLQERLAGDSTALHQLHLMEQSATRGAELVRQVLSFARGMDGTRRPTNMSGVLAEVARLARGTFPRSIVIETEVPDNLWFVVGDATHLHQVFMNLLVNARDAMPRGGRLRIDARNEQLSDAACAPFRKKGGRYVVVQVSDTGMGIPPEIIERIFEPFFTTKPHGEGTGLGLSTAHGIVASHGGFMRVASERGAGTTFDVCLPVATQNRGGPATRAGTGVPLGQGEVLLLIDDEASIRTAAAQTLETHGYRVLTAENGAEGIAVFNAHSSEIQLVVTDLMMPVCDGATCATELRRRRPDLPIIRTSGMQVSAESKGGGEYFLPKPYTASALLTTVRRALDETQKPSP